MKKSDPITAGEHAFVWIACSFAGVPAAIIVSSLFPHTYQAQEAGMAVSCLVLLLIWGFGFYNLHLSIKKNGGLK